MISEETYTIASNDGGKLIPKGTATLSGSLSRNIVGNEAAMLEPVKQSQSKKDVTREALKFFFSEDGALVREFVLDEVCNGVDALSRDAVRELFVRLGIPSGRVPLLLRAMAPKLSDKDRKVVDSLVKLINFFSGGGSATVEANSFSGLPNLSNRREVFNIITAVQRAENREKLTAILPTLREFAPNMRDFGRQIIIKLTEKGTARFFKAASDVVFGPEPSKSKAFSSA